MPRINPPRKLLVVSILMAGFAAVTAGCSGQSENSASSKSDAAQPVAAETSIVGAPAAIATPAAFTQCTACHSVERDGKSGIGPNLHGIVGAKAGTKAGFAYSPAMAKAGFEWTAEQLDKYLEAPWKVVPGTKMAYAGQKNVQTRKEIIEFLATLK